jgi:putative lipoic acid-binding regulatory protein
MLHKSYIDSNIKNKKIIIVNLSVKSKTGNSMKKEKEFYQKLKISLEETTEFPSRYMYKFIIPSDDEKFKEIEKIFDNTGAVITSKKSKSDKYTSLTILVDMKSSDDVITKYKEVSVVEGIISL